jgi:catechol 2,3-dioxygenase-like lactoylglutathione lyase family enzyme
MPELTVLSHHAGLTVRDLDAARDWYAAAFGFQTAMAFELPGGVRGAMLQAPGGARVELFEVEESAEGLAWADPPAALRRRGFGHVALEVSDLDAAFAAAVEAGGAAVWDPRRSPEPGRRMAFVHDPEGNLVELIGPAGA